MRDRGRQPSRVALQVEALESRDVPAGFNLSMSSISGLAAGIIARLHSALPSRPPSTPPPNTGIHVDLVHTMKYEAPLQGEVNAFSGGTAVRSGTPTVTSGQTSQFQITLRYVDNSLTASQKAVFSQAAQRWSQIIIGDIPDGYVSGIGNIDDVAINVKAPTIDGNYGILGQAGPTDLRSGSYLPLAGVIEFDKADMARMESDGSLYAVALHEMGHVLGFGTIWDMKGLISGAGGSNPRFTGAKATAQYQIAFNSSETSVPVENSGGEGTRDAHWRESTFNNELMTGYISTGNNPLSRVTAASMADLGYKVELSAADPYGYSASTSPSTPGPGDLPGQVRYADVNGDGKADLVFQTKSNAFYVWPGASAGFDKPVKALQLSGSYVAGQAKYGDVDGDGKVDLIFQKNDNSFWLCLSTGTTFNEPQKVGQFAGTYVLGQAQYADVNGDGKVDLLFQGNNVIQLALSQGTTFAAPQVVARIGGSFNGGQVVYRDFNGDGRADLIFRNTLNEVWLGLADGTGLQPLTRVAQLLGSYKDGQVRFADINGDRKIDLLYQNDFNEIRLALSDGTTFLPRVKVAQFAGSYQMGQVQYADIDGDGKADLMFQRSDNAFLLALSKGTGFSTPNKVVQHPGSFVNGHTTYADINGDGKNDLLIQDQNGVWLYLA